MDKMIQVTTDRGIPFNVRVVEFGEGYGRNDFFIHEKRSNWGTPLVEFYDARYDFDDTFGRGQFVSRYYLSTLIGTDEYNEVNDNQGLCLHGGVDDWYVDADNMKKIRNWLKNFE